VGVLDGHDVVYVGRAASRAILGSTIHIGSRLPAHATASGKTLIASQDDGWVRSWLERNELVRYTTTTLADVRAFLDELAQIRARGYAVSNAEFEAGISSVAAPIVDASGETVAAVNVSTPANVLSEAAVRELLVPAVRETAAELSRAYGASG
jgi:IclR family pca regulon transcriptional regulator